MIRISLLLLCTLLTSCTTVFYQVYKVKAENSITIDKVIGFEDDNCIVTYDLWDEFGDSGFTLFNKTGEDIVIDLTKSFFVKNGFSTPYFRSRVFTQSFNSAETASTVSSLFRTVRVSGVSSGRSTSFEELPEVIVPPGAKVNVSEYIITDKRYLECDFPKHPTPSKVKTLRFDKDSSPIEFYNLITYTKNGDFKRMEHSFFISEITNYPASELTTRSIKDLCGKKVISSTSVFKQELPDQFYIKYAELK